MWLISRVIPRNTDIRIKNIAPVTRTHRWATRWMPSCDHLMINKSIATLHDNISKKRAPVVWHFWGQRKAMGVATNGRDRAKPTSVLELACAVGLVVGL